MKRITLTLVAVVFLTMPVLAGEIDGGGRQPPPPPPPVSTTTTTQALLTKIVLALVSIMA